MSVVQHQFGFTVANVDSVVNAEISDIVFRSSLAETQNSSISGDTALLTFNANETKTIALPIGYSSAQRSRFIVKVLGTVEMTVTHPTLSNQIITIKNGSCTFSMMISSISCTEKAGSTASLTWSHFQCDGTHPGEFT